MNEFEMRNTPLDEHPQEWYDKHYIIKLTTILGKEFYMWNPGQDVIWTEDKKGAYRYSNTDMGRVTRDSDMLKANLCAQERGVDGRLAFEEING